MASSEECREQSELQQPTMTRVMTEFTRAKEQARRLPAQNDLQTFWRVCAPFWLSTQGGWMKTRLLMIAALTALTTHCQVDRITILADSNIALHNMDIRHFFEIVVRLCRGVALECLSSGYSSFLESTLGLKWREWTTQTLLMKYSQNRRYYEIQSKDRIDNPDLRLHEDVSICTEQALTIFKAFLRSTLDFILNVRQLLLSHPPTLFAILGYTAVGTGISSYVGHILSRMIADLQERSANFRFALVRLRVNAESVAFYAGEENERNILMQRFQVMKKRIDDIIKVRVGYSMFSGMYFALVSIVPYIIASGAYFRREIDLGFFHVSCSTCASICNDCSILITLGDSLASFRAAAHRLSALIEAVQGPDADDSNEKIRTSRTLSIENESSISEPLLKIEDLAVKTPDGSRLLFQGLSLELQAGQSLLVMGHSGCGKTSLMRVLAELWNEGSGHVHKSAAAAGAFFLPQKPYLVLGSLREQMLYPTWTRKSNGTENTSDAPSNKEGNDSADFAYSHAIGQCDEEPPVPADQELEHLLTEAGLEHLLRQGRGLDEIPINGWEMLSLGEQQRLALTRLALTKPKLALLDECTSALDEELEEKAYRFLIEQKLTFVSIGHRSTLKKFHTRLLRFQRRPGARIDEPSHPELFDLPEPSRGS